MVFSILAFVTGILVVQQLSVLPANDWLLALLVFTGFLAFLRQWRLMFFTIGMLWAIFFASHRLTQVLPGHLQGLPIRVTGQVIGIPRHDDRRVRFDFAVSNSDYPIPAKIRLSWFSSDEIIKSGQYWQMTVKLKKPHGRMNPGSFDYQRWLFVHNIGATGYVRHMPAAVLLETSSRWKSIGSLRQFIADQMTTLLAESDYAGLIKALSIGVKDGITEQQWDVFRKTGSVHLLAISGLHIGLISGLVYFLMQQLAIQLLFVSPQKFAAIMAMLVALFYSALAGFSIPTQRSLIMLMIAMSAITLQRNTSVFNTLAVAMLAVLLVDPLSVLSAGFWLSFLAVTLIVYCIAGRLGKAKRFLLMIKIHCVTAIGLSPLLLYYFQQLSVIAPLANFIAVPVISVLLVPLCFLAVLLIFVSNDLAAPVLLLIEQLLHYLWIVLAYMADLPYASLTTAAKPFYMLPFALLGVFILLAPRGIPARWLGCVMLLPLFLFKQDKPALGDSQLTLLDVGQGLATVIETAHHSLIFDTGAKYSERSNMGRSVVIPFLQFKGIDTVDTLLISHGDNDHIGGAQSILHNYPAAKVLTSVPELLAAYLPVQCVAGQSWEWDEVFFEIISPVLATFNGENNNSCVLKISSKQGSILLTGDIEQEAEGWLTEHRSSQLKSDVLIAPHHGSKTSSSLSFLRQVNPDLILIPAGYRNRFSFPHTQVLQRYKQLNIPWMSTANSGAIKIVLKNKRLLVESMRNENRRYWHK